VVNAELVGKVIQGFRKSKKMSQEVVSGLAGLDRTHYSKIERGLRSPTIDTLFKIAHALDVPPHELIIRIEQELERQENDA
jgi:transcriptional regulator with XRE-family HTH domain